MSYVILTILLISSMISTSSGFRKNEGSYMLVPQMALYGLIMVLK